MNYLDDIADRIARNVRSRDGSPDLSLYRIYAVLCLAKGNMVTSEDVHNAWCAWQAGSMPEHRSLVPFSCLSPEVQALDDEYRDAIKAVSHRING